MKRSIYRTLLIWAVIVLAVINIYPTVGWLILLDEPAREARIAKWKAEDDERAKAKERPTQFQKAVYAVKRWVEFDRKLVINLGLDLQGGIHMVFGFDLKDLPPAKLAELRDTRKMSDEQIEKEVQDTVLLQIRRRVADFEADEPIIQALGTRQIQVQLPGEKDIERAKSLMTKVAELNFHIVSDLQKTADALGKIKAAMPEEVDNLLIKPRRGGELECTQENFERVRELFAKAEAQKLIPADKVFRFSSKPKSFEENQNYRIYMLEKEPLARGEGLTSASAIPDQTNPPYWQILFQFNNEAGAKFGEGTARNLDKPMAIVVDDVVLSAPTIRAKITTRGQITGSFEGEEARDLAIALNSGSMVVKVREDFTRVVGASLGADAVRAGYISAGIALAAVGAFMCFYYLGGGVVALIVLALNSMLVVAAMAYFGLTLTMPGIAGLILTIAVAVDGNVLIYERIREEMRNGHSVLAAIESGFERAGITILDANITNLIAAAVLYQFGTGPLEGFSVALAIGICVGVFTALIVSHAMIDFMVSKKLIRQMKMLSLIPSNTSIRFLEARNICMVLSVVMIVVGWGVFFAREQKFGVDFTSGTSLRVTLPSDASIHVNEVREALASAQFSSPVVQESGQSSLDSSNEFLIRVGETTESGTETKADGQLKTVGERIQDALAGLTTAKTAADVKIDDLQTVGPAVGAQLRWDALKALASALFFVLIFLWYRFDWRFAGGAVTAVLHDIVITVGFLAILNQQITMNVVAGLLTTIGYSLNDTIVVFDRVREDMKLYRGRGYTFVQILNLAINSTLSRTMLTSGITIFVLIVLYGFGGDAIHDFALTLIIGMVVGTYSSIYIASPVTNLLREYRGENKLDEEATKGDDGPRRRKVGKKRSEAAV